MARHDLTERGSIAEIGAVCAHSDGPPHRVPGVDLAARVPAQAPVLRAPPERVDPERPEIARAVERVGGLARARHQRALLRGGERAGLAPGAARPRAALV